MRKVLISVVLVAICCVSGCKSLSGGAGEGAGSSGAPGSSAASGSPQAHAGALIQVHDPGQVTGTAPASCHALPGPRPDPACTPGAVDPSVTQANLSSTICVSGYTSHVRPAVSQTDKLKGQMYRSYGIPDGTASELDHLVPLELGGANDATNLWPEVGKLPNAKDKVENDLHRAVCSGKVPLAAAQRAIASDWLTAEQTLGLS